MTLPVGAPVPGAATGDRRRRTHPITPLLQIGRAAPAVLIGLVFVAREGLPAIAVGALVVVGALVAGSLAFLQWQRRVFWFDDDGDLRQESGLVGRQERRLQLSRLQGVEVVQPLLARLVGLAQVRVEAAGGADSTAVIEYLPIGEAEALRAEVLARSAGLHAGTPEAPEEVLHTVPTDLLVKSLLLRGTTAGLLLVTVLIIATSVVTAGPGGLVLVLLTGGIPLISVVGEFTRFFDFTVARSPDGLRLRYGLTQRQTHTVPPGRVQAIGYEEPLLWRSFGWVRVRVTLAGSAGAGEENVARGILLPVAPWPVARAIVAALLPGSDPAGLAWSPSGPSARLAHPLQWRRLGVAVTDDVIATCGGWATRWTSVAPHARTQSVELHQGLLERMRGAASVHVHTVDGPVAVVAHSRPQADARRLAEEQAARAETARRGDRTIRWMRGGPPVPPSEELT